MFEMFVFLLMGILLKVLLLLLVCVIDVGLPPFFGGWLKAYLWTSREIQKYLCNSMHAAMYIRPEINWQSQKAKGDKEQRYKSTITGVSCCIVPVTQQTLLPVTTTTCLREVFRIFSFSPTWGSNL